MSLFNTLGELEEKFGPTMVSSLDFLSGINELLERIYTSGRYPSSVVEVPITLAEIADGGGRAGFTLDTTEHDLMVAVRDESRGYDICDIAALYKHPAAGFGSFIDMGLSEDQSQRIYRAPADMSLDHSGLRGLLRKRPPRVCDPEDRVPVLPASAVRVGLQAIGFEIESDPKRADVHWNEFWSMLLGAHKEFDGPKRRMAQATDKSGTPRTNFR